MNQKTADNPTIEFDRTGNYSDTITVLRTLPNKSKEVIGKIFQHWSDEDISITYECRSKEGDELCITTDWIEAENVFEKYAKHLPEKSAMEKSVEKGEPSTWYTDRQNEAGIIRDRKGREDKSVSVSK